MNNQSYIYFNGANVKQSSEIGISGYNGHFGVVMESLTDIIDIGYVLSSIGRTNIDDPSGIECVGDVGISDIYLSVIEPFPQIGNVG